LKKRNRPLSAEEGREYEFHCAVCTGGVAESDFDTGKAIRREGEVYCRKCFRQTFPDECEKHPGTKLTVLCAVCGKLNCPDCTIEIQGKKVCETCKPLALARFEKGEEIGRVTYEQPPEEEEQDEDEEQWAPVPFLLQPKGVLVQGLIGTALLPIAPFLAVLANNTAFAGIISAASGVLSLMAVRSYYESRSRYVYQTLNEKFLAGIGVLLGAASLIFHWGLAVFFGVVFLQDYSHIP
jgi:hypothetical protein